jgi:hypothetical protein
MLNNFKVLSKHAQHFQSVEQCVEFDICWHQHVCGAGALFKNFLSTLASWRRMWSCMSSTGSLNFDQFRMCGFKRNIRCVYLSVCAYILLFWRVGIYFSDRCERCGKSCRRIFPPASADDSKTLRLKIAGSPCVDGFVKRNVGIWVFSNVLPWNKMLQATCSKH